MTGFAVHPWLNELLDDPEVSALFSSEAEVSRLLRVEAAWTRALGQLDKSRDAERIAQQIETTSLPMEVLAKGMISDGVPIPALVKCLKELLPAEAGPLVHQGLTSQDVLDTSFVLLVLEVIEILQSRVTALDESLVELESRFGRRCIPAFTRMQRALDASVASVIRQWRLKIPRIQSDIQQLQEQVSIVQWGGPIGERCHPEAATLGPNFADHLGLRDPGSSWHTDRSTLSDVVHTMGFIATLTGKIGEDIAIYALTGSGQHLSFSGGTSSAMPHKNNPVDAETLVALSDFAAVLAAGAARSARHEGQRSGQALVLEWLTLPQLFLTVGTGLLIANRLTGSITMFGRD